MARILKIVAYSAALLIFSCTGGARDLPERGARKARERGLAIPILPAQYLLERRAGEYR